MLEVLIGIFAVVAGIFMIVRRPGPSTPTTTIGRLLYGPLGGIVALGIGLFMLASTSFIFVDANQVGHLKRIYAFKELPPGRIIALNGEKGPQAEILGPGFHFIPLVRVLYDFEEFDVVTIPEGYYGQLTTLDGQAMPSGMFMAPAISDEDMGDMLKADVFLTKGGLRGPQETVLKPGQYRMNRYLFDVRLD
ncbi:hypothetical protein [uncultured Roseibium sp.]|uniref:hypothetical protein n=1 Tax=uncultured Roseibium sp. TaxID=1936171 RepID=UPI003217C35D